MSNTILVIGESGSGKSTSLRNLNPETTFIFNVLNKPLPFRNYKQNYKVVNKGENSGNYYSSDDYTKLRAVLQWVNSSRPDIKDFIIDDFQYLMASEFMSKALEKGYDKFTILGKNVFDFVKWCGSLREDLNIYFLSHNDVGEDGKSKMMTIGKILDEKVKVQGMFTIVLHSYVENQKYYFITNHDGKHLAKSPIDMFDSYLIDNDLTFVKKQMESYFNSPMEDVPQ